MQIRAGSCRIDGLRETISEELIDLTRAPLSRRGGGGGGERGAEEGEAESGQQYQAQQPAKGTVGELSRHADAVRSQSAEAQR